MLREWRVLKLVALTPTYLLSICSFIHSFIHSLTKPSIEYVFYCMTWARGLQQWTSPTRPPHREAASLVGGTCKDPGSYRQCEKRSDGDRPGVVHALTRGPRREAGLAQPTRLPCTGCGFLWSGPQGACTARTPPWHTQSSRESRPRTQSPRCLIHVPLPLATPQCPHCSPRCVDGTLDTPLCALPHPVKSPPAVLTALAAPDTSPLSGCEHFRVRAHASYLCILCTERTPVS